MSFEELSNEAVAPKSSLKSRLLGRRAVKAYFAYSGRGSKAGKQGLLSRPEDEQAILKNPLAREIITNDGSTTFLVHSTDEGTARKISEHGLGIPIQEQSPDTPFLKWTTKMLAKHNEAGSVARNTHGLGYRFEGNDDGEHNRYKVVAELPMSNPGTSLRKDPFEGTALGRADGVSIVAHGEDEETAHGQPFSIPPERIRGYFDVETGDFIHNERFRAVAQEIGFLAVEEVVPLSDVYH